MKARNLWREYAYRRQTVASLAEAENKSERQIRRILRSAVPSKRTDECEPGTAAVVMDTTYFPEGGVMVFRCQSRKRNLFWRFVEAETNELYIAGLRELEKRGWEIPVAVCDGKKWLAETLESLGYDVQLCQFHMTKTVTRYLTKRPALLAGIELRRLSLELKSSTEERFSAAFAAWRERWKDFLREKTVDEATGRWQYTHRRIRAAEAAIRRSLPYLFTFERHRDVFVPKTTNTLDGSFSQLKQKINTHRGLNPATKRKMVETLLDKSTLG